MGESKLSSTIYRSNVFFWAMLLIVIPLFVGFSERLFGDYIESMLSKTARITVRITIASCLYVALYHFVYKKRQLLLPDKVTKDDKFPELNFCFWAKLIVGIPALFLAGCFAGSFFENYILQMLAAGITIGLLIYLAIKIDRIPALSCKIKKNSEK